MPPPIKVELLPHDPAWAAAAWAEGSLVRAALGSSVIAVHHIGSTAIPGISAKPILDLIPVACSLRDLDDCRAQIEGLGYAWWGEYGLPGRRFCTKTDPGTGRRLVQLHCYAVGSPEIDRHLAFRDYLCERPDLAQDYDREKARCRALHPEDSHAYSDCKSAWIKAIEADALAALRLGKRR